MSYPSRGLRDIFRRSRTIAVVGASYVPAEPAYFVPEYLKLLGYQILPVNPLGGEILGAPVHRRLADVAAPVDIVSVFRSYATAETTALEAAAIGATTLWYQPGVDGQPAGRLAPGAGLTMVTGRCIGRTHAQLGLGPPAGRRGTVVGPRCARYRPSRRRTADAAG